MVRKTENDLYNEYCDIAGYDDKFRKLYKSPIKNTMGYQKYLMQYNISRVSIDVGNMLKQASGIVGRFARMILK